MAEVGPSSASQSRSLLKAAVHDISRLAFITNVLVRHGFSAVAIRAGFISKSEGDSDEPRSEGDGQDAARRFRAMLEELGPTFVKVGQILSTRPDALPPPFIRELAKLQDSAPAVAFDEIKIAVEAALEGTLEERFAHFDPVPVASASMAQAHRATLHDGTPVIVKVQRPGVGETMRSDLDLMHVFARLLEATIAEMDYYAPADIVDVLDEALSHELDFLHEATNLEQFGVDYADDPDFRIPALYRSHTTRTVLTMEFIAGRRIADLEQGSPEAERIALLLIEGFFRMIFTHGMFHGDPHPGNLIVADDGRLALIDFGLCGYLSQNQRDRIVSLVVAVLAGDVDTTARTLIRMGRPTGHIHMAEFKAVVSSIRDRYLKRNLRSINVSAFVEECIDAAQRYKIRIATDYSILSKATVTLEGVIRGMAPDLDLMAHVGPYQRRLLEQQYSADRLLKGAIGGAMHLGTFLREVPDQLEQVLLDVEAGRFQVKVSDDNARAIVSELNRQTTRVFMALCCAALIIATPLFLPHEPFWLFDRIPVITTFTAMSAAGFAFWGLAWHVAGGRVRDWRVRMAPILKLLRR